MNREPQIDPDFVSAVPVLPSSFLLRRRLHKRASSNSKQRGRVV
jgi:hypothetical protein